MMVHFTTNMKAYTAPSMSASSKSLINCSFPERVRSYFLEESLRRNNELLSGRKTHIKRIFSSKKECKLNSCQDR